ncbi:MAG TPA: hypothetical protein VHG30_05750, partial [Microvirga sp.]|nr:hypothetical protein [Microvirga sp.]
AQLDNAIRTQGILPNPSAGLQEVVAVEGPGCFISANLVRQGDDQGVTVVQLEIDGQFVVNRSIEALINAGATSINTFGVMVQRSGALNSVTIGFPEPLFFSDSLVLSATVGGAGIAQLFGEVITAE